MQTFWNSFDKKKSIISSYIKFQYLKLPLFMDNSLFFPQINTFFRFVTHEKILFFTYCWFFFLISDFQFFNRNLKYQNKSNLIPNMHKLTLHQIFLEVYLFGLMNYSILEIFFVPTFVYSITCSFAQIEEANSFRFIFLQIGLLQ